MQEPLYFVGVDVGGTNIKAGVVDDEGTAISSVSLETEASLGQDHGLKRICESIRQAVAAAKLRFDQVAAIGVATPGTMDIPAGMMLDPPNMKPWHNVPVRQHVADVFKKPTAFQNDANAAAFGEYWVGAGRGTYSMVLFTLGTGIGGGIIIANRVLEGRHSHGGEVGHTKIQTTNGRLCGCGKRGCLEAYASATSVVQRTREALQKDRTNSSLHSFGFNQTLSARSIFTAAGAGDVLAKQIVEETAFYLAVGAANLMHVVDPDMVAFSGGMTAAGEPFLERIRHHVREIALPVPATTTRITYAKLGLDAGFIGAAACARQLVSGRSTDTIKVWESGTAGDPKA